MKLMKYEEWIESVHRADGISEEFENETRKDIVSFMIIFGDLTDLESATISKAIFIFHKYSKAVSFKKFNVLLFAATCIFIAAKFEDLPLKLSFTTRLYLGMSMIYQRLRVYFPLGTKDLTPLDFPVSLLKEMNPDSKVLQIVTESILEAEKEILSQIGYELDIELPDSYITQFENDNAMIDEGFLTIVKAFVSKSWRTTLCLYFEPQLIVIGAIKCALAISKYFGREPSLGTNWMKQFGAVEEEEVLEVTKYLKELK